MEWRYCYVCGKIVDEHETNCYWCDAPKEEDLDKNKLESLGGFCKNQLMLKFGE